MQELSHVYIAIVGAGFAGLGTAIRLKQQGIHDFTILERADDLGGTWRDNGYPGCACDVPSHLYSFSFAPNPDWSDSFSGQAEIWAYLRRCATRYGLDEHLRLRHEVRSATWDPARGHWAVETNRGTLTATVLVAAGGPLSEPAVPDLPGLDTFGGVSFHSARWRHDHDLSGRRVAVIGTGASAIQFVPRIAPAVARLDIFQRTAPWLLPRRSRPIRDWERRLYRSVPPAQRLVRAGIYWGREGMALGFLHPPIMRFAQRLAARHLARSIPDPGLRARLTPDYTIGCKRVLLSNDYLPALNRPNVNVIGEGIREITRTGVVTASGAAFDVDTIIFGTGFHVTDMPIGDVVRGRDGRTLAEVWRGSPQAYLGTSVTGFPNLFLLLGPNTGLGHTSVVFMIECQIEHLLRALDHLHRTGQRAIEPTPQAQARSVTEVDRRMRGTVWLRGGCHSWYLDRTGRNSTLWPGQTFTYRRRLRRFDPGAYQPVPVAVAA